MDFFNYTVYELLARTAAQERLNGYHLELPTAPRRPSLVKRALASSLVRLGLRLDPAAGEGLSGLDLALAQTEARS